MKRLHREGEISIADEATILLGRNYLDDVKCFSKAMVKSSTEALQ